jgi:type II secretory pathway pseudopilin PulG
MTATPGWWLPTRATPPISTIKRADDRHDGGNTLIEMLIVIMLMGVVVTTVLSALQVTIRATTVDREQAVAFSILQAASDQVFTGPHESCLTGNAVLAYNARARGAAIPTAWESADGVALPGVSIDVIGVEYLGRVGVDDDFEWGSFCFEGPGYGEYGKPGNSSLYTQRVTIQLTFPDGTTTQTLEMVKSKSQDGEE